MSVRYDNGRPVRVEALVPLTQHRAEINDAALREAVIKHIVLPSIPPELRAPDLRVLILAQQVVARGWARRCIVQFAYAIGVAEPVSFAVETFGTGERSAQQIAKD